MAGWRDVRDVSEARTVVVEVEDKPWRQVPGREFDKRRSNVLQPEEEIPLQTRCRCSGPSFAEQPHIAGSLNLPDGNRGHRVRTPAPYAAAALRLAKPAVLSGNPKTETLRGSRFWLATRPPAASAAH